ncbi:hypothetical protein [Geoglobus acetivorans]|uniref:Uncharacterized protein n=1 Tax=Geoglobus acetivorans TaxID=565033 RepID=A0ABZ3H4M5_GEOAI|nr:hypothetical protein [Geoglobus acetivorans]
MRTIDNVSTAGAVLVGATVFAVSLYSLYADYTSFKPTLNIAVDLALLFLSAIIIGGSLNLRKRLTGYEVAAERAFDEVVYSRLKPIIDEVAIGIVEINALRKKVEDVENKISVVERLATEQKLTPEYKVNFYFRALIAMLFYLGTFIFMTQYTLPYLHLVTILLFIYWWLFITHEFEIFNKGEALIMFAAPVLIAPSSYLLLRVFIGTAATQAIMFLISGVYAYYYYNLAKGLVGGEKKKLSEILKITFRKKD